MDSKLQNNIKNRTIFCRDNIEVLKGINSNSIDLVYLDPPFNKKKIFTAPIGSASEGASFKDYFREEDVKDEWLQTIKEDNIELFNFLNGIKAIGNSKYYLYNYCYLTYMSIRLVECQRILKETGSIYLHCDPTMSHYLKILMDILFGEKNFRNEIIWCYSHGGKSKLDFARKHDTILRYSKTNKFIFNGDNVSITRDTGIKTQGGRLGVDEYGRPYQDKIVKKTGKIYRYYLDKGKIPEDHWTDINSIQSGAKERTGYPTQKPLALLERIIKASSNEGDMVLDPFCGCATSCVASEKLNRQWVGIDVSHMAYELVKKRLESEVANPENLLDYQKEINFTTTSPKRTDEGSDDGLLKKYIYIISNKSYLNEYKVGIASDVKARLNSYQTSDPNRRYKLEFSFKTSSFREIEKHIHDKFENRYEWVRSDLKKIIEAITDYK